MLNHHFTFKNIKDVIITQHAQSNLQRIGFSLIELIVILVFLVLFLGLLFPALISSREAAKLQMCEVNLKRFGEAIQNFNEKKKGLPPITIGQARPSIFILLSPYYDKTDVWDIVVSNSDNCQKQTDGKWWNSLSKKDRKTIGTISLFHCPSRRSGVQTLEINGIKKDSWGNREAGPLGPLCDYAVPMSRGVNINNPLEFPDSSNDYSDFIYETKWDKYWDPFNSKHFQEQHGPFRVAIVETSFENKHETGDYRNWKPRDNVSRFSDGLSYQILLGEKHIPATRLHQCSNTFPKARLWDCGVLFPDDNGRQLSFARGLENTGEIQQIIVSSPKSFIDGHPFQYSFGSFHPGSCPFVFADGTTKRINKSITPLIICQLGCVDDGQPDDVWW